MKEPPADPEMGEELLEVPVRVGVQIQGVIIEQVGAAQDVVQQQSVARLPLYVGEQQGSQSPA